MAIFNKFYNLILFFRSATLYFSFCGCFELQISDSGFPIAYCFASKVSSDFYFFETVFQEAVPYYLLDLPASCIFRQLCLYLLAASDHRYPYADICYPGSSGHRQEETVSSSRYFLNYHILSLYYSTQTFKYLVVLNRVLWKTCVAPTRK